MSPQPDVYTSLVATLRAAGQSDEVIERFVECATWLLAYPDLAPWRDAPKRVRPRETNSAGSAEVWIRWVDDADMHIRMHNHADFPRYISYTLWCRTSSVSGHLPEPRSPYGPRETLVGALSRLGREMRESGVGREEFRERWRHVRGYGEEE